MIEDMKPTYYFRHQCSKCGHIQTPELTAPEQFYRDWSGEFFEGENEKEYGLAFDCQKCGEYQEHLMNKVKYDALCEQFNEPVEPEAPFKVTDAFIEKAHKRSAEEMPEAGGKFIMPTQEGFWLYEKGKEPRLLGEEEWNEIIRQAKADVPASEAIIDVEAESVE